MIKKLIAMTLLTAGIMTSFIACSESQGKEKETASADLTKEEMIKRGEYLVATTGCDDCHSPKKMGPMGPEIDEALRLSGYPASRPLPSFDSNAYKKGIIQLNEDLTCAAGPWGVSFAANLTSDESGAGSWPAENFITSIRQGKLKGHADGRTLLPPMPWQNFAKMSDADLKSIHAYLQTTRPVENVVPGPKQFAELH